MMLNPMTPEKKFEEFRKAYPGTKRGNLTEFLNFKKKHKDSLEVLDFLSPLLSDIKIARASLRNKNEFVPPWKNLQTWINQRCWEDVMKVLPKEKRKTLPQTRCYKTRYETDFPDQQTRDKIRTTCEALLRNRMKTNPEEGAIYGILLQTMIKSVWNWNNDRTDIYIKKGEELLAKKI